MSKVIIEDDDKFYGGKELMVNMILLAMLKLNVK